MHGGARGCEWHRGCVSSRCKGSQPSPSPTSLSIYPIVRPTYSPRVYHEQFKPGKGRNKQPGSGWKSEHQQADLWLESNARDYLPGLGIPRNIQDALHAFPTCQLGSNTYLSSDFVDFPLCVPSPGLLLTRTNQRPSQGPKSSHPYACP